MDFLGVFAKIYEGIRKEPPHVSWRELTEAP